MDTKLLARIGAAAFVGIAAAMTIVQLREEPPAPSLEPRNMEAAATDPLSAQLRACARMGEEALTSPDCHAAWAQERERFFGVDHSEAYSDLTADPVSPPPEER